MVVVVREGLEAKVEIARESGNKGAARFADDQTTERIVAESAVLIVEGTEASDPKEKNMVIKCSVRLKGSTEEFREGGKVNFQVIDCAAIFAPFTFTVDPDITKPDMRNDRVASRTETETILQVTSRGFQLPWSVSIAGDGRRFSEFKAVIIQNVLSHERRALYPAQDILRVANPLPMLDVEPATGIPFVSPEQVADFAADKPAITKIDSDQPSLSVTWKRRPEDAPNLEGVRFTMRLTTWIVAVHKNSGCMKRLFHVTWDTKVMTTKVELDKALNARTTLDEGNSKSSLVEKGDGSPVPVLAGPIYNKEVNRAENMKFVD